MTRLLLLCTLPLLAARTPAAEPLKIELTRSPGPAARGAVLDTGPPWAFDADWTASPCVLADDGAYRMWYSAHFDAKPAQTVRGIGLALSDDGRDWRRAAHGKPILTPGAPGALDDAQVFAPKVLFDGRLYRMWYTGQPRARHSSGFGYYRVFLATSPDGVAWTRANEGRPVIDLGAAGAPDAVQAATPAILQEEGEYFAWYAAFSPAANHSICLARSRDGVHFEKLHGGRPVEGLQKFPFAPTVAKIGGRYLMLYMSLAGEPRSLHAAVSDDRIHWRPLRDGRPVLPLGGAKDFDRDLIGHGSLLVEGDRLRLWYTGYRRERNATSPLTLRIGLAEGRVE